MKTYCTTDKTDKPAKAERHYLYLLMIMMLQEVSLKNTIRETKVIILFHNTILYIPKFNRNFQKLTIC